MSDVCCNPHHGQHHLLQSSDRLRTPPRQPRYASSHVTTAVRSAMHNSSRSLDSRRAPNNNPGKLSANISGHCRKKALQISRSSPRISTTWTRVSSWISAMVGEGSRQLTAQASTSTAVRTTENNHRNRLHRARTRRSRATYENPPPRLKKDKLKREREAMHIIGGRRNMGAWTAVVAETKDDWTFIPISFPSDIYL